MTSTSCDTAPNGNDFALEFGTGGLRALLGDGPSRMNLQTIGRAAQGVAQWMGGGQAVIAYDSRRMSEQFARHTACVLAANGVKAYLFTRLTPTPALSFAVRAVAAEGGRVSGICITASHNPAEYNGFKVYGSDGGQITLDDAEAIAKHIAGPIDNVNFVDFDHASCQNTIEFLPETVLSDYLNAVESLRLTTLPCDNLRVAYTPLNGAGRECVEAILRRIDAEVHTVPEQAAPDGNFPTCPKPNPEEEEALALGKALCLAKNCHLLLATDPDCDRVGVAVNHHGTMHRLSGNEVGLLLLDYIARLSGPVHPGAPPPIAIKTIVTAPMAADICRAYGIELRDVLTGFKFIGEQIGLLERDGEEGRFLFGFEESCGYLSGTHARDKDGVNAAMLICDMAADYLRRGLTLVDAMEGLYQTYGRWSTRLLSFPVSRDMVDGLRRQTPEAIAGRHVLSVTDYAGGAYGLPPADVLLYTVEGGTVIVRPSGTEPKVKVYFLVRGEMDEAIQADAGFAGLFVGRDAPENGIR